MKRLSLITASSIALLSNAAFAEDKPPAPLQIHDVHASEYLVSRFAQKHHDWNTAGYYINRLIQNGVDNAETLQRAMILAIGSGKTKDAINVAHLIKENYPEYSNTVVDVLFLVEALKEDNFETASTLFSEMPKDATMNFIGPFLQGWIDAGNGKMNISSLQNNSIQLYHGILISDLLEDHTQIKKMIDKALKVEDITAHELERLAALYGHVGNKKKALELYDIILKQLPNDDNIKNKVAQLESDTAEPLFEKIKTARHGSAQAFSDIAKILHNEDNDETARVFAHIALYLAPDLTNTVFLLGRIYENNAQYDDAITAYKMIPASSEKDFKRAQIAITDIYKDMERYEDALNHLEALSKKYKDVDTIIRIGDLHRSQSNFGLALKSYDKAVKQLGDTLPNEYWHLHYARGISYEQTDNWKRAEEELKAALSYQPDHPYILNYLGYAWADQGINLPEALQMIKKAVQIRPSDGYITDSLGWVMYRTKDYHNAVKALERAVELLPYDPTVNDHLGDAYWQVGRRLEARFQWERAKNHTKDTKQIDGLSKKLASGLKK